MLGSSEVTAYDLRFRLFNVPVRVNPWFWLAMLLVSGSSDDLRASLVFIGCAFVSILAHEFGHGLAGRAFGSEPTEVVLYGFGGYCGFLSWPRSAWRQVAILLAGPGAGLLLYGLTALGLVLVVRSGGEDVLRRSPASLMAIRDLLYINLVWSILNLFPIWPLDGGRITESVLSAWRPFQGKRWTHVISLLTAGGFAAWRLSGGDFFAGIWFALFALMNYRVLQDMHDQFRYERSGW